MSHANGVQIIGDKIYYKMELIATMNPFSLNNKSVDEFKKLLINIGKEQK